MRLLLCADTMGLYDYTEVTPMKLIKNVHVYAPEDRGIQDILLCNDRIIAIRQGIAPVFEDTVIIDGSGKTAFPGFIDQHVHIIGGGGEDGFASLISPIRTRDCVQYGLTGVIGLLGTDAHAKSVEALVAKTKALKEEGMSAWCLTGSYAIPTVTLTGSVGKDIVFVEEILGVKTAISDHRSSAPTVQELARLASEARTAGLLAHKPGIVHLHTGRGKAGLKQILQIVEETDIPIAQFRPTHCGNQLEDALVFAAKGGYIDFTAGENTAHILAGVLQQVPLAQVTLSSDSNGSFPKWSEDHKLIGLGIGKPVTLFETIRDLIINEHVPVSDAISLITRNVAQAMMLQRKGALKEGYDADIVLTDDSLRITDVMCRGEFAMRNGCVTMKEKYSDV